MRRLIIHGVLIVLLSFCSCQDTNNNQNIEIVSTDTTIASTSQYTFLCQPNVIISCIDTDKEILHKLYSWSDSVDCYSFCDRLIDDPSAACFIEMKGFMSHSDSFSKMAQKIATIEDIIHGVVGKNPNGTPYYETIHGYVIDKEVKRDEEYIEIKIIKLHQLVD